MRSFDYEVHAKTSNEHAQSGADVALLRRQAFDLMRDNSIEPVSLPSASSKELDTVLPALSLRAEVTKAGAGLIEQVISARFKRSFSTQSRLDNDLPIDPNKSMADSVRASFCDQMLKFIDPNKSVDDLVRSGVFISIEVKDKTPHRQLMLSEKQPPRITVQYESRDPSQPLSPPNFIVRRNGSVIVVRAPDRNPPDADFVVQAERDENDPAPSLEQQNAISKLVDYLRKRIEGPLKRKFDYELPEHPPGERVGRVRLNDHQNFVLQKIVVTNAHLSSETLRQIQNINRFNNAEGSITGELIERRYIPPRDVPPQTGGPDQKKESVSFYAIKNVIASLFHPDRMDVYSTARTHSPDHCYRIGRYGLTANLLRIWLVETFGCLDFDNPDVVSKLVKLEALGVIPHNFAKKMLHDYEFRRGFKHFLARLDGEHKAVTAEELRKFMPKELQERIATDLVRSFAEKTSGDPAKIALGFLLGKPPDKFTKEDLSNKEHKEYMHAATRLFGLLQASQIAHPGAPIHFDSNSTRLAQKIAHTAAHTARRMNTRGWCARGVETTLAKFGVHYNGNAKDTDAFFDRDPRFRRLKPKEIPKVGDVCVLEASPGHPWGHTFVFLGNGLEASDHIAPVTYRPDAIAKIYRMKIADKANG